MGSGSAGCPPLSPGFLSDPRKCFSRGSKASALVGSPRRGPAALASFKPQPGFAQSAALPPEPSCLDLPCERTTSRKCWHSQVQAAEGSRLPAACWSSSRPRWLQATGWMTQVGCAGQTSWYSHASGVTTVISSSAIAAPPPSEGGLARPGARARGDGQECGYLGLCLVAQDASRAGLGAEPVAPALSVGIMEAAGLKEPNSEQGQWDKEAPVCLSKGQHLLSQHCFASGDPKERANWRGSAKPTIGLKPIG